MTQTSTTTAQARIARIAAAMGWTVTSEVADTVAVISKGTREITVRYGLGGQVIEAKRTSKGLGRRIEGVAKAEKVCHLLTLNRWTPNS